MSHLLRFPLIIEIIRYYLLDLGLHQRVAVGISGTISATGRCRG
jgi:hypothetical protein